MSDTEEKQLTENSLASVWLLSSDSEDIQDEFVKDLRPILIVCYTNHALDQFLEGIADFYKLGGILRVGGRSKSKTLEQYNLSKIRTITTVSSPMSRNIKDTNRKIYELKRNIASLALELDCLKENIMHIGCLTNGNPTVNDQLDACYDNRSKDYEDYCHARGYTKLLCISPTTIWLQLFEKMDEMVRLRRFYTTPNEGKTQMPKTCRLYDMSNESDSFIQDIREEMSRKIAFEIQTSKLLKGSIEGEFLTYLRAQLMSTDVMSDEEEEYIVNNVISLSTNDRWRLYRKWMNHRYSDIVEETKGNLAELEKATLRRAELDMQKDKQIMQNAKIIGMTTTCAAKYHMILNEVKPRIIIVEEAAEVFESHVIACLNPACDQMILVGDHKQLRPAPATYDLAVRYHLDVSLFERMVTNGIHCDSLKMQHRMRPSIAKLVRKIYPDLLDHKSVQCYKNLKGLTQNMFFVSHEYDEFYDEDQKTYSNQHEAMFAIALLKYISQQGYKPYEITLLTTYKGQLYLLKNLIKEENVDYQDLVVTVVDNYQGEENDIVVLSLVRSNRDGDVGFLKQANRICVALSRAKKGLYIIGNARKLAESSTLWSGIVSDLKEEQLLGEGILLYCQNHPEKKILAITGDDFKQAPEGGCQETCDIRLHCGHVCERKCHILDSNHDKVICEKRCIRKCKNGHQCSKRCNESCGNCKEMIIETLKCGHITPVACHIDLEQYICDEVCNKKLQCGHTCKKKCKKDCYPCDVPSTVALLKCKHEIELKCGQSFIPVCQRKCDKKLQCGHDCTEICGHISANNQQLENEVTCALGHKTMCNERCDSALVCTHKCRCKCTDCFGKRLHYPCSKRCNCDLVCGHTCEGSCGDCYPCERPCEVSCSHRRCKKACKDPCQKCQEPCMWECPHFKCTALCSEMCNRPRCDEPCRKKLKCGHMCIGLCGERCPTKCFICNKEFLKFKNLWKSESRTIRIVELEECSHLVECEAMDAYMDEQETPVRFKRCPECTKPIRMSMRYNNVVKYIQSKVEELKCAAGPALEGQNDLLNDIENSNIQNIRSVIESVDTYFISEASIIQSEVPAFLNTIILSRNYAELGTPRRNLVFHQTILDVSAEIKRYFDTKVLEQLCSSLNSLVQNVQSESESCAATASKILDSKARYDQESQEVVEKCIIQLRSVLPSVHAVVLNLDIIPVSSVAAIKTCSGELLCNNLAPVAKSEETAEKQFRLQLFIQERSAYYNIGTSRMAPGLRQTETSRNQNIDKRNTSSLGPYRTAERQSKEKRIQPDHFGKRKQSNNDRLVGSSSKKRKTDKEESNVDAYSGAFKKSHTSIKLNKRTNEQTNTAVEPKKRKEKSNQTEELTQKQNTINCSQKTEDLGLIESLLKKHEKGSDVTAEVIDEFKAKRVTEQNLNTKASPEPCTHTMPMTIGHVPRMKYVPAQAPSEDTFHGLKDPAALEDQPEEIKQIPDLRQKINKDNLRHKFNSKKNISSEEDANSETVFPNPIYTNSSTLDLRTKLKIQSRAHDSSINKTSSTSKQELLAHAAKESNIHSNKTKHDFDMSWERRDKLSATHGDQRKVKVVNEAFKLNSVASTTQGDYQLFTQYKDKGKIDRSLVSYDDLL